MTQPDKKRFYVGVSRKPRELFSANRTPTIDSHGHRFGAVIGPFRTKRGAMFMRDHGANNPHCRSVSEAERLAR